MRDSKSKNINGSLGNYYASNRAAAFMNYNDDNKSIIQDREFGRVFAEYKDKLVIIDGENKHLELTESAFTCDHYNCSDTS